MTELFEAGRTEPGKPLTIRMHVLGEEVELVITKGEKAIAGLASHGAGRHFGYLLADAVEALHRAEENS